MRREGVPRTAAARHSRHEREILQRSPCSPRAGDAFFWGDVRPSKVLSKNERHELAAKLARDVFNGVSVPAAQILKLLAFRVSQRSVSSVFRYLDEASLVRCDSALEVGSTLRQLVWIAGSGRREGGSGRTEADADQSERRGGT